MSRSFQSLRVAGKMISGTELDVIEVWYNFDYFAPKLWLVDSETSGGIRSVKYSGHWP